MSIVDSNNIDAIGIERKSNSAILTISDHLVWDDDTDHLLLLQNKLNSYVSFIESGQLVEIYPNASGRSLIIDIVCKYPLNKKGRDFIEEVEKVIEKIGIRIRIRMLDDE
jgi:hypothetical protein